MILTLLLSHPGLLLMLISQSQCGAGLSISLPSTVSFSESESQVREEGNDLLRDPPLPCSLPGWSLPGWSLPGSITVSPAAPGHDELLLHILSSPGLNDPETWHGKHVVLIIIYFD